MQRWDNILGEASCKIRNKPPEAAVGDGAGADAGADVGGAPAGAEAGAPAAVTQDSNDDWNCKMIQISRIGIGYDTATQNRIIHGNSE